MATREELEGAGTFPLSADHRMLLRIRDTLYEGDWGDFVHDLRCRAEGRPHVYETIPQAATMHATIVAHLKMIEEMQAWEREHGCRLPP